MGKAWARYGHGMLCVNPSLTSLNPLNAELNPICYLLALLGAHNFLHYSRIKVNTVCTNAYVGCSL